MINNYNIVILESDKDSTIIKMDKKDYVDKFEEMIKDGIKNEVCETTGHNTFGNFKKLMVY